MATLSMNKKRVFEFNEDPLLNDLPCVAADVIYEGSAVGYVASTGYVRPATAGATPDEFAGFCIAKADNSAGAAGDVSVRVRAKGIVKLSVATAAITSVGDTVYASDDDTFTLASGGGNNVAIGTVHRWISGTTVMVRFEATGIRSV